VRRLLLLPSSVAAADERVDLGGRDNAIISKGGHRNTITRKKRGDQVSRAKTRKNRDGAPDKRKRAKRNLLGRGTSRGI